MKRIFLAVVLLCLAFTIFGSNKAYAGVSDYIIRDFQIDYYLDQDDAGRSALKTVESITADFPANQNHGIYRQLIKRYDKHLTDISIESINDTSGNSIYYITYSQGDSLVAKIGDPDNYVSGLFTYVITYTQRDVTRYFANTNDDEFYWDVNGSDWLQPIDNLVARVHISDKIVAKLTNKQACYFGKYGVRNNCNIVRTGNVISANANNIGSGENLTVAIGFLPRTFARRAAPAVDRLFNIIVLGCFLLLIFMMLLRTFKYRNAKGRGTIIAEYLPPSGVDVPQSSTIRTTRYRFRWVAATIVDLAVRNKLRIVEVVNEKYKMRKKRYAMEIVSLDGLTENEDALLKLFFNKNYTAGARYQLGHSNETLPAKISKLFKTVQVSMVKKDYLKNSTIVFVLMLTASILIECVTLLIMFLTDQFADNNDVIAYAMLVFLINTVFLMIISFQSKPVTTKGRELYDYLEGLKLYIKTAEADRIKILQSPSGAERVPIDTNDKALMVKLYEKVLPYAVLFGQEKKWAKELSVYYEQCNIMPVWFAGNIGTFDFNSFSSSLSVVSSSISSSSSSFSTSGGSGGGGFSGGGGGGGGGGGW